MPSETLRSSLVERWVFYRTLGLLLNSGVTVNKALETCAESTSPEFGAVLLQVATDISQGHSLWDAMGRYPLAFRKFEVEMLRAGGESGALVRICESLSQTLEQEHHLWMEVRRTLTYPLFVLGLSFLVVVVVPPYLFRPLFAFLKSTGAELPLLSRLVAGFSKTVSGPVFWMLFLFVTVAGATAFRRALDNRAFRERAERVLFHTPLVGSLFNRLLTIRFAQVLGLALKVGLSFQKSFVLATRTTGSHSYNARLGAALDRLKQGATPGQTLQELQQLEPLVMVFADLGAETGRMPEMLEHVTGVLDEELRFDLERTTALMEPAVLMLMGLMVGVFVLAAMLPMTQLLEAL